MNSWSTTRGTDAARVAVVGDNTMDLYSGTVERVLVGGNALNVAAQFASRGDDVLYFGAVGDDEYGHLVRNALSQLGMDLSGVRVAEGATATTNIELTATNDRVFVSFDFGVTGDYLPTNEELDRISQVDWVHIGMVPAPDRVKTELRWRNPSLLISQDLSVSPGSSELDVSFQSADNAVDPRAVATKSLVGGAELAIVTLGARGVFATNGLDEWWQPSVAADVIDTTGAGDSFAAGFIRARLEGADIPASLLNGSEFAAVTCSHVGGWQTLTKETE